MKEVERYRRGRFLIFEVMSVIMCVARSRQGLFHKQR